MPHVITQSCCSDGSCVYACPVNCIHPSPDEPGFATAEMLYIDPVACVDCGACVSACPVGAIAPDTRLEPEQLPFIELNAAFYPERPEGAKLPPTSKLAPVHRGAEGRSRAPADPLTVAIVGSGPAAMYAADELLTQPGVRVNVFERLPTPYGLVRAGVAPDHQSTKRVTRLFDRIAERRGFRFYLNVEVGIGPVATPNCWPTTTPCSTPSARPTTAGSTSTAWACRAPAPPPRWWRGSTAIPNTPICQSIWATSGWSIVGNGNVALDVARILTTDPDALARTDISDHALAALRASKVHRSGDRRPPRPRAVGVHAARTDRADVDVRGGARRRRPRSGACATWPPASDPLTRNKLEILSKLGDASAPVDAAADPACLPA